MAQKRGSRVVTAKAAEDSRFTFRHPLEPETEISFSQLAPIAGLTRLGVSIARVAPGKRSFPYHRHQREEEWVYVLEGTGETLIEGEPHAIGPGDFVGYPAREAHTIRNTGDSDLVYLMGGERLDIDVAEFPDHNKLAVASMNERFDLFDLGAVEQPFGAPRNGEEA